MLDRSFLSDILNTLFERSVSKRSNKDQRSINDLCIALLDTEGEVSGLSLAGSILTIYDTFEKEKKLEFFKFLNDVLEINISDLQEAITTYQSDDNPQNYSAISQLSEPKRLELLRRLNQPDGATLALVEMRTDLLEQYTQVTPGIRPKALCPLGLMPAVTTTHPSILGVMELGILRVGTGTRHTKGKG